MLLRHGIVLREVDIGRQVRYQSPTVILPQFLARAILGAIAVGGGLALLQATPAPAAVLAEGVYTINAPERRTVPFRMILTPSGARITPTRGETLVFSYEKKTALVIDAASRSYFMLPLELVPPLLAAGIGYDPRGLGATASGATRTLLGRSCSEVVVKGNTPLFTLRSCRLADQEWSRDYARLERAVGLPWVGAAPPAIFVGLPLSGRIDVEGARPYHASWEITRLSQDERAGEDFSVPAGYRMDLERLLRIQGPGGR